MGKADGLSRRPDWQEGVEKDNEDQKLIKSEWIREGRNNDRGRRPKRKNQKGTGRG